MPVQIQFLSDSQEAQHLALILNVKPLNKKYVRPVKFWMETLAFIIPSLQNDPSVATPSASLASRPVSKPSGSKKKSKGKKPLRGSSKAKSSDGRLAPEGPAVSDPSTTSGNQSWHPVVAPLQLAARQTSTAPMAPDPPQQGEQDESSLGDSLSEDDVADGLQLRLSREPEGLNVTGITRLTGNRMNSGLYSVQGTFRAHNVTKETNLYCVLFKANDWIGRVSVTDFVYELPTLSAAPIPGNVSNTSVTIIWRAWDPAVDDGDPPVVAYIPYYLRSSSMEWQQGGKVSVGRPFEFRTDNLEVDIEYDFSVAAVREGENGEGPRSPSVTVKTLCNVPNMVASVNVQLTSSNKVNVSWQLHPGEVMCSTGVTTYKVYYRIEGSIDDTSQLAGTVEDVDIRWFIVDDGLLQPGSLYIFFVTVTTDQESDFRESKPIQTLEGDYLALEDTSAPAYLISLIIIPFLVITAIVFIIIRYKRKHFSKDKKATKADDGGDTDYVNAGMADDPEDYIPLEEQSRAVSSSKYEDLNHKPQDGASIPPQYEVAIVPQPQKPEATPRYHTRNVKGVNSGAYEDVGAGSEKRRQLPDVPQSHLSGDEDEDNNYEVPDRLEEYTGVYINIKAKPVQPGPIKAAEVKLDTNGSDARSDYINASYIKQGKTSFIAAQGPQESTVDDFWKMVWQENVETIVMVTDNIETNKGDHKTIHTVTQVQVHSWPYGSVPKEPASLISIIKKVKSLQTDGNSSHLLVHCSNGVGATGTFIAVYVLMDTIKKNKDVNVFDFVKNMREDRVDMVQTRIQYLFIFECLLAVIQSTDSQISCDQLKKLGHAATSLKSKKEYKALQESVIEEQHCEDYTGNSPENQHKNRFMNLIPVDKFRPVLKSEGNTFGTNSYINAIHLADFSGREFIITQTPLSSTVEDFWRLVYDYECATIVMLNNIDGSDETAIQYWPSGGGAHYGLMKVVCTNTANRDLYAMSDRVSSNPPIILFIVPVAALLLLCIIVGVFILLRMKKKQRKESNKNVYENASCDKNDAPVSNKSGEYEGIKSQPDQRGTVVVVDIKQQTASLKRSTTLEEFQETEENSEDENCEHIYSNLQAPDPIKVAMFEDYVICNANNLEQEFEILKKGKRHSWAIAENEIHKKKNRFKNMLTCPNTASLDDFWRMVWEQKVSTIVMITNLYEGGKERCSQYWPEAEGSSKLFRDLEIKWSNTLPFSDFVVRKLSLHHLKEKEKEIHQVHQFHFLTWPDMLVPKEVTPVLEFVKQVKQASKEKKTPTLVHCSAGIGRTGTFIALSCLMDVLMKEKVISVFDFVENMRENRINMVQTSKQYLFLYKCLLEFHQTRHTEIPVGLLERFDLKSKRGLLLQEHKMKRNQDGLKEGNRPRNRFPDKVPYDGSRPFLVSSGSGGNIEGYINATILKSFTKQDAFISTQSPLPNTIDDFWKLVFDWNCTLIVMLNQLDPDDQTCMQYCSEDSVQFGSMTVNCVVEEDETIFTRRVFEISHVHSERIARNQSVDVFSSVRQLRQRHPDFLSNEEDYLLCYELIKAHVTETCEYQNI
ncbi:Receptor-type tyrosine-protein phosphatase T [Holothuria leucospilota]|uniref:Receptor-type tyrosine-protein phosphatase T n=1 Tax=Holothuria leucospilota TaxID=206669 RepID=A0A9Q1C939_HOLLE|nr:Receptor-type tyrosine-protein phosphatase T [Holothuria leucospilota]